MSSISFNMEASLCLNSSPGPQVGWSAGLVQQARSSKGCLLQALKTAQRAVSGWRLSSWLALQSHKRTARQQWMDS